jgi:hypothetical protein
MVSFVGILKKKMASCEQFLDDYKISRLVCDSDDSEGDRHSDDDIDSIYDVAHTGDHVQPENTGVEHSETGESTDQETNVSQGKDFTWGRTPSEASRARRENLIVHHPGCVDEAKNANTPHDAFSLFISHDILNIILNKHQTKNS